MPTGRHSRTAVPRFLTLPLVTLPLVLSACSSTVTGTAGAQGGGSPAGSEATGATIGQGNTGIVSMAYPSVAAATFVTAPRSCVLTIPPVGGCVVDTCATGFLWTPEATASAGPITITGGAQLVQLEPLTDPDAGTTTYSYPGSDTPVFSGDQPVEVTAKGAAVPAFDQTILSPGIVSVTSPPENDVTVDSRADFPLAWISRGPGQIGVELGSSVDEAGTDEVDLFCVFDASSSGGVLPAAQLQAFKAQASTKVVMFVYPFTYDVVTPSGWTVLLHNEGQYQYFMVTLE